MGIAIVLLICILIICCCCDSGTTNTNNSSDSNMMLDVERMHKDSIDVTLGRLSEAERRRREKSGYYIVPKGQEYSRIEELRKKRVEKITKDWIW